MTNRKLKIIAAAAALLILGVVFYFMTLGKNANVVLTVAPSPAKVTIDAKEVNQGELYLKPGDHKLKATMAGFADKTIDFKVEDDKKTELTVILVPNSEEGFEYLRNNPGEATRRESLGGEKYDETVENQVNVFPLIKDLPFIDHLYRIDYGPAKEGSTNPYGTVIYIKYYSEAGKTQALEWLRFKGYDTATLEIVYQNAVPHTQD